MPFPSPLEAPNTMTIFPLGALAFNAMDQQEINPRREGNEGRQAGREAYLRGSGLGREQVRVAGTL